ncbi:UNVERIFIED_CONTAM: hypothetical protein K2H54_021845 [Gekko kuhli]
MDRLLLFLLLFIRCPGSLAQFSLLQPPAVSVSPGGTVKLSCNRSDGGTLLAVLWFQQRGGESPRYLLGSGADSSEHRGSGVPDRFSGSMDPSNTTGSLTVTNVQAEDEADYYCLTAAPGAPTVTHSDEEVRQKLACWVCGLPRFLMRDSVMSLVLHLPCPPI